MTSEEFIQEANNHAVISSIITNVDEKQVHDDIKKFTHRKTIKTLLLFAGEKIIDLLLKILAAKLKNKYTL